MMPDTRDSRRRAGRERAAEGLLLTDFGRDVDAKAFVKAFRAATAPARSDTGRHAYRAPRKRINRTAWISVAACLAIIVGTVAYNIRQSGRLDEALVAHVKATTPGVEIVRDGRGIVAFVDMPIRPGDRIRTAKDQDVTFEYDGEPTQVRLRPGTTLDVGDVLDGKKLDLPVGMIDATVAPQVAGKPMVITTPQARIEVKGTTLSLGVANGETRLDVFDGMVRMTRISDGASADVAGGHYAVAAPGVALAAQVIPEDVLAARKPEFPAPTVERHPAKMTTEGPEPRTHLDGNVIFEDDFSNGLVNWEPGEWSEQAGFTPITENVDRIFQTGTPNVKHHQTPLRASLLLRAHSAAKDRFVCVRTRKPISEPRFVVAVLSSLKGGMKGAGTALLTSGIEARGTDTTLIARTSDGVIVSSWTTHRWEFEPADAPGTFKATWFSFVERPMGRKDGILRVESSIQWRATWLVRPASTRILLGSLNRDVLFERVTVREFREESANDE